jgi:hypothetical protein
LNFSSTLFRRTNIYTYCPRQIDDAMTILVKHANRRAWWQSSPITEDLLPADTSKVGLVCFDSRPYWLFLVGGFHARSSGLIAYGCFRATGSLCDGSEVCTLTSMVSGLTTMSDICFRPNRARLPSNPALTLDPTDCLESVLQGTVFWVDCIYPRSPAYEH